MTKAARSSTTAGGENAQSPAAEVPLDSNAIQLSALEWVVTGAILLSGVIGTPAVFNQMDRFDPQTDFRLPYALSHDYWTYERLMETAIERDRIVVIGDSVVWGEYVDPQHTLSHFLNQEHGTTRFVNGGVNGTHPLALEGLVRYYAKDLRDTSVMVHCNLLWMSSEERDLQTGKETTFNHPRLVPQFLPRIPSYKAPLDERLGVAIDHHIAFRRWVHHLRVAGFDGQDVYGWTLEHPYENPLRHIAVETPRPQDEPHSRPISWTQRGIAQQDIPWIDLDTSLQWRAFRTAVDTLRRRGNQVFVIVGPFNEHLLTAASRRRYRGMRQQVEAWLDGQGVPSHTAALLPSEEYGDASHPLSAGYARIAQAVSESASFQQWLGGRP